MKLSVRPHPSTLIFSKATLVCVIFVMAMSVLFYVLWQARPAEAGVVRNLFAIASGAPAVGIVIALLSLVAVIAQQSRSVLKVRGEQVVIPHSGVRFPTKDLARLTLFSRGDRLFAMIVPHAPIGDPARYTVEFPQRANKKPHQLAKAIEREYPDVIVERLGSSA